MKSSSGIATSSGNSLPRGAWLVVMFLFIVGALNYIDRNMLTTMRFSIMDSIPMSDAQFGLLTSVFLWVYGLMSPLAGYLADKFKRSHIIIFSLLVWSLVTWMTGHATTFNQLLSSRALMGISEAFYMPAMTAIRYNKPMKEFYERLVSKGKPKKVALIAVANKLLRQAFAVLKSGCPYDPHYLKLKSNLEVVLT